MELPLKSGPGQNWTTQLHGPLWMEHTAPLWPGSSLLQQHGLSPGVCHPRWFSVLHFRSLVLSGSEVSSPCTLTGFPAAPESSGSFHAGPWKFILLQPQVASLVAVFARNSFQVTCTSFWHVRDPVCKRHSALPSWTPGYSSPAPGSSQCKALAPKILAEGTNSPRGGGLLGDHCPEVLPHWPG